MIDLLVGCPVSQRAWILPRWHDHVAVAADIAGVAFSYAFVIDPLDVFSVSVIEAFPVDSILDFVQDGRSLDERSWNHDRYFHMAFLRNRLLRTVSLFDPPFFLSLDSDILLHPDAIKNMLETTSTYDVVGGKTFMTPGGTACPSWGFHTYNDGLRRSDADGVFPVEVVMAVKLLTPKAYEIPYEFHSHGEDLGFSINCRKAGLSLGVDARVTNKHVMRQEDLEKIDERCGF
jgi:hypothetical protein